MIVSVLSRKGGCGKSTSILTLASVFRTTTTYLIVDADPRQAVTRLVVSSGCTEEKLQILYKGRRKPVVLPCVPSQC